MWAASVFKFKLIDVLDKNKQQQSDKRLEKNSWDDQTE